MNLKNLFKSSLKKTISLVLGSKKSQDEILESIEEQLILADISANLVNRIMTNANLNSSLILEKEEFFEVLKNEIKKIFNAAESQVPKHGDTTLLPPGKNVILLVGINGSGKTTSAAKLASFYRDKGQNVLLSAADTFRAAGSSQLTLWGERLNIPVVGGDRGADPGSVVFNSLSSFSTKDFDLLIVDTAGRVQTRENLMKELEKLTKIVKKFYPDGPTETLLVIDATMGQNTLDQAKKFKEFSGITGIFLSKIDGTAKGGTVINIVDEMKIPVRFVGSGETADAIAPFSSGEFIDSLFSDSD